MADTTFTDMGRALDDATAQYRAETGVSPDNTDSTATDSSTGSEAGDGAPQGGSGADNSPKTDNTPVGGDGTKGSSSESNSGKTPDSKSVHQFNHAQAAARIARKRARERKEYYERIDRLQAERDSYADKDSKAHNPQLAAFKDDQIREAEIAEAKRRQDQFTDEAYEIFQDEETTQSFIEDCKIYGDWINTREPQLAEYVQKPLGKLVLKGWFDKVAKNPQAADWWESLTPFEKYKTLDSYYKEFESYVAKIQRGEVDSGNSQVQAQQQSTPKVQDIPVPSGGRNTNNVPPTNNFSLELERAMQANGVSKLVR